MPTTSNFGWTTPADTDLVKDGALAIRTLGNGIDTSFLDLKGGTTDQVLAKNSNTDLDFKWVAQDDSNAIQNAIVDAKGDLISATAADTPARLAVGANGTVLTADSTEATGLKWASPAGGGGMTLLNSGGTSLAAASSVTINITSTGYTMLQIFAKNVYNSNSGELVTLRINGDTGTNYTFSTIRQSNGSVSAVTNDNAADIAYIINSTGTSSTAKNTASFEMTIYDPQATDTHQVFFKGYMGNSGTALSSGAGIYDGTAVITSLTFGVGAGTFSGGTIYVYGVK